MNRSIVVSLARAALCGLVSCAACADAPEAQLLPTIDSPKGFALSRLVTKALPDGRILDVVNSGDGAAPRAFVYTPRTNRWVPTDSIDGVEKLVGPLVPLANEQIWALGEGPGEHRLVARILDIGSGHWREAAVPPPELADKWRRVVPLTSDRILVLTSTPSPVGWIYEAGTNRWAKTSEIPGANGGAFYAGPFGEGTAFVFLNSLDASQGWVGLVYESERNLWRASVPLQEASGTTPAAFVRMADGSMLLVSFTRKRGELFSVLFHPDRVKWEHVNGPPLSGTDQLQGIYLLSDGRVLMLSNTIPGTAHGSIFDPDQSRWASYGNLPNDSPTAQVQGLLPNGDVWAVGYGVKGQWSELVRSARTGDWTAARVFPANTVLVSPRVDASEDVVLYLGHSVAGSIVVDDAMRFRP